MSNGWIIDFARLEENHVCKKIEENNELSSIRAIDENDSLFSVYSKICMMIEKTNLKGDIKWHLKNNLLRIYCSTRPKDEVLEMLRNFAREVNKYLV